MNEMEIFAFIITPLFGGAVVMSVLAWADWVAKRERRAQLAEFYKD